MTSGVSFTATGSSSQLPAVSYQFSDTRADAHIDPRTDYRELPGGNDGQVNAQRQENFSKIGALMFRLHE